MSLAETLGFGFSRFWVFIAICKYPQSDKISSVRKTIKLHRESKRSHHTFIHIFTILLLIYLKDSFTIKAANRDKQLKSLSKLRHRTSQSSQWLNKLAVLSQRWPLIVRSINCQDFKPMWSQSTSVTDGRTDGRHWSQDHALHYSASRGKMDWALTSVPRSRSRSSDRKWKC